MPHNHPMTSVLRFFARALLVVAGLVFAASLAVAFVILLAAWSVRAAWARLTGRRVTPFVMRTGPRAAFHGFVHRGMQAGPARRRDDADVTDVEIKAMR